MSRKDPSTACCEDMLIKIKLPDTKASDITLDIQEKLLDFRSPQKRLLLHLPHPVDTTGGKACFLSEQATLEVTLRMKREFDFINFA
ncbi:protein PIH1D3 [Python bivittatus]|uniref:Protein PIH1D3 n=1 Tax=Python bivittatus TaxID=176946 RepID=A0A9F2RC34_PYTBI|nr:protein PIH1D3 [Python bivittatus]